MSEITRYDYSQYGDTTPYESEDGPWVKYEDHLSTIRTLQAENEALRELLNYPTPPQPKPDEVTLDKVAIGEEEDNGD